MQSITTDKQEPIVKFVAQLRRYGMALLFPQRTHDFMLVCLFTAITMYGRPIVHREFIELTLSIKESGHVPDVESISKNKVRGVLEILKQAHCVVSSDTDGTVRLFLAPGITTFQALREKHDHYLSRYIIDHRIQIPENLKPEMVWDKHGVDYFDKVNEMDSLIVHLLTNCVHLKDALKQQYLQPSPVVPVKNGSYNNNVKYPSHMQNNTNSNGSYYGGLNNVNIVQPSPALLQYKSIGQLRQQRERSPTTSSYTSEDQYLAEIAGNALSLTAPLNSCKEQPNAMHPHYHQYHPEEEDRLYHRQNNNTPAACCSSASASTDAEQYNSYRMNRSGSGSCSGPVATSPSGDTFEKSVIGPHHTNTAVGDGRDRSLSTYSSFATNATSSGASTSSPVPSAASSNMSLLSSESLSLSFAGLALACTLPRSMSPTPVAYQTSNNNNQQRREMHTAGYYAAENTPYISNADADRYAVYNDQRQPPQAVPAYRPNMNYPIQSPQVPSSQYRSNSNYHPHQQQQQHYSQYPGNHSNRYNNNYSNNSNNYQYPSSHHHQPAPQQLQQPSQAYQYSNHNVNYPPNTTHHNMNYNNTDHSTHYSF